MSKRLFQALLVAALLVGSVYISLSIQSVYAQNGNMGNEVLFSIPVGKNGIHYDPIGGWAPSAFTVAPDGSFWIADTYDNHLLHFSPNGSLLDKLDIDALVVGAGALQVTSRAIWVLDMASIPPKVVEFSLKGKWLRNYDLPKGLYLEDGLSGMSLGENGEILIERVGGIYLTELITSRRELVNTALDGYASHGKRYVAHPADITSKDPSRGYILAGDVRVTVSVPDYLGGPRFLGTNPDGSFFAIVEELLLDRGIQVDQMVYRYSAAGQLQGMARVPVNEESAAVQQGIAIGPDRQVYVLVPKLDHAEIQRLRFRPRLLPIITPAPPAGANEPAAPPSVSLTTCISRDTMLHIAAGYFNNVINLSSYHINDPYNQCLGRQKPRYFGTTFRNSSVAYDWNGNDSVSQYNAFMSVSNNAMFAGDINGTTEGCSRGVDCSGFVSNAWALGSSHYGTCTLETISTELGSALQLKKGDIMNRCGVAPQHVILFARFEGDGMWGYEATTLGHADRVVYLYHTLNDLKNAYYKPRRYNNVCPTP